MMSAPSTPVVHDFKLTIESSSMLFPSQPTDKRIKYLSDIDQLFNFPLQTVHFFIANPHFSFEKVADSLRSAIERVLVPYDFLAGRLRVNEEEAGRVEINCNAAGVDFVVSASELRLEDIGDLDLHRPSYEQLVPAFRSVDQPICSFQLTSFRCGGFSLGISVNHTALDGISSRAFFENIASMITSETLVITPFMDRSRLSHRTPLKISFPHPEITELTALPNLPLLTEVDRKLFRFDAAAIEKLKRRAHSATCNLTRFKVVVAHIWRCKSLAIAGEPSSTCMVAYIMNIREKLRPPLPKEYAGNGLLISYAAAKARDLADSPFFRIVEWLSEGEERVEDEYARSMIDYMFHHRGFFYAEDLMVSSFLRLGFSDVKYPWGRPAYVCPVGGPIVDSALLLPSFSDPEKGVNALVTLRHGLMEKFTELFHKLLADEN